MYVQQCLALICAQLLCDFLLLELFKVQVWLRFTVGRPLEPYVLAANLTVVTLLRAAPPGCVWS